MPIRFNISIERVDGRRNIEVHNKWLSRLFCTFAFIYFIYFIFHSYKFIFCTQVYVLTKSEDISFADDQLYGSNNHQVQNNTEFYVAVQRES